MLPCTGKILAKNCLVIWPRNPCAERDVKLPTIKQIWNMLMYGTMWNDHDGNYESAFNSTSN